jgi:hypothetical protein
MRANALICAATVAALAWLSGCAIGQSRPPPPRPFGEIAREERGEIVTVNDTRIDLSTGMGRAIRTRTPVIPAGPIGVSLPVQVGGEKRVEVPAEEITVRLASGQLVSVVQELSNPPFAPGERVRVLYERADELNGKSRMKVVRD